LQGHPHRGTIGTMISRAAKIAFLALVLLPPAAGATGYKIETIALSGQAAPGIDPPAGFRGFLFATINANGDIAFSGSFGQGTYRDGYWAFRNGVLQKVIVDGEPVGASGTKAEVRGDVLLNTAADVIAWMRTDATAPALESFSEFFPSAILAGQPPQLAAVAVAGGPPPLGDEGAIDFLDLMPLMSGSGFFTFLSGTWHASDSFTTDLWRGRLDGTVTDLLLVERLTLEGPAGEPDCCVAFPAGIDATGRVYASGTRRDAASGDRLAGMWLYDTAGQVQPIAFDGQAVPGSPGLSFKNPFDKLSHNDAGDIVFSTELSGAGVNAANDLALWYRPQGAGEPVPLAREGDPTPDGGSYGKLPSPNSFDFAAAVIDAAGTVAFCADDDIWYGRPGSLSALARGGDPAPGMQDAFAGVYDDDSFGDCGVFLNGAGDAAFVGQVGAAFDSSNSVGLWVGKPGALSLVTGTGRSIAVRPGDWRTVQQVFVGSWSTIGQPSGGQDGRGTILNDAGQVVFVARFTDGSRGVFRATPTTTPPEAAALSPIINYLVNGD